jgi:hypothetical protein
MNIIATNTYRRPCWYTERFYPPGITGEEPCFLEMYFTAYFSYFPAHTRNSRFLVLSYHCLPTLNSVQAVGFCEFQFEDYVTGDDSAILFYLFLVINNTRMVTARKPDIRLNVRFCSFVWWQMLQVSNIFLR